MFFRKQDRVPARGVEDFAVGGVTLIDVRSPEEFAQGHIEGALNIPVQDLAQRLDEIRPGRPIAVYCRSGRRSAAAAELLSRSGYETVTDLGGWDAGRLSP